jgi:protein involved in polysaccharide export with SLBB domain
MQQKLKRAPEKQVTSEKPEVVPTPPPAPEPPSEFEQFVSGKVEISETQFQALSIYRGISFSPFYLPPPDGKISVPVRIVRPEREEHGAIPVPPGEISFGFITGPPDVIAEAFRLLGISSRYAILTELKQFGHEFFRAPPDTFAPVETVPVGPDYVVGPGDEIRIAVWGKIDGQFTLEVDRDGKISIPKVGTVGVAGLTFRDLKEVVHREFSKYYTGFEMNISFDALRTINVFIVGNARQPGAYSISALSTLVNALFVSGGPSKAGSMRDIQVKRSGETIVHFDLYDFLLNGDTTKDIRLMAEDVILIPPVGPVAAVAGSVNNPGLYELKDETSVISLVEMAGGLTPVAFGGRVRIERIVDGSRQAVFESDMEKARALGVPVRSGDILRIYPVVPDKRFVRVSGAVQREGDYGFTPGMTVKDLVSLAGGLKYFAYRKEAELTRVDVTDAGPRTEKFTVDLEKALEDSEANLPLQENDYLFIRTVPEWKLYQTVTVSGEVKYPGTYTIQKGEKLSSLIERAGGFTDRAFLKGAVFTRERVRELQQTQIDEMVDRLERELAGRAALGVSVAINPEEARIKEIEIRQMNVFLEKLKSARANGRMVVSIADPVTLKGSLYDIELEEGDRLTTPANPQSIQVAGSVFNQTAFVFDPEKSMRNYVELAGGYTENADKKRVYILKVDGTATRPGKGLLASISWNRGASQWEYGARDLDPGDTIVVPEKLERIAWLREIKDITQILYQIAVTAGVVIVAF